MANTKSGYARTKRMSPLKLEIERSQKLQGPKRPPPPPSKDSHKLRDSKGNVIRALAGASVPPARLIKKTKL